MGFLLEALDVLDVPEVMRCVPLCMLEAMEMLDVLDVMHRVLLCMLEVCQRRCVACYSVCWRAGSFARGVGDVGRAGRDATV